MIPTARLLSMLAGEAGAECRACRSSIRARKPARRLPPRDLDLEFANGERRRYERLHSRGHGAVMIARDPGAGHGAADPRVRAGVHRYELGLPKGRMDAGEAILDAPTAN
jgi:ADP-ribose diphosphatase